MPSAVALSLPGTSLDCEDAGRPPRYRPPDRRPRRCPTGRGAHRRPRAGATLRPGRRRCPRRRRLPGRRPRSSVPPPREGHAMTTTDTAELSISEAADLIRKRKLSPIELTEACLERIAALDARVRAFITVTREAALASAQQAAAAIAGGHYKGPLPGIPIALKDLF